MKVSKSTILTWLGALGVGATSVLAVRATPAAMKRCEALRLDRVNDYQPEPTKLEYVKECWKCYIPSVLVGTATIACIFGANALNKKQQAALTSAYALLNEAYKEYRHKVRELYGEEVDESICEEVTNEDYEDTDIHLEDGDKYLFYDTLGLGYFESTIRHVIMDDGLECYILEVDPVDS